MSDPKDGAKDPNMVSQTDVAKDHTNKDEAKSTIGDLIGVTISKAGDGITKAGEELNNAFHNAGDCIGETVGLGTTKKQKQKKNPKRAIEHKKFQKRYQPVPREEPKDTNVVGNITKLLPANTFLMFQTLAPLATNDGKCGDTEKFMTGLMLLILASTCIAVCFTDTFQYNGKVYHGVVTWRGLWNPSFKGDPAFLDLRTYEQQVAKFIDDRSRYKTAKREAIKCGLKPPDSPVEPIRPQGPFMMGSTYSSGNKQYCLKFVDFLHAVLSAVAFGTLTLLTSPVTTCFYPNISSTIVKTLPLLVGFVISAIFAFSPPARNGIAHPLPPRYQSGQSVPRPADPKGVEHGPQLPPKPAAKGGKKRDGDDGDDGSVFHKLKTDVHRLLGSEDENVHHQGEHQKGGLMAAAETYGEKVVHDMMRELKSEAMNVAPKLRKDVHLPPALLAAANSEAIDKMMDMGQVMLNRSGSQALAKVAKYAQGAKDAGVQIHQDVESASPLMVAAATPIAAELLNQQTMALAHAQSFMHQGGYGLSPLATQGANALYNQAGQAIQSAQLSQHLRGLSSALDTTAETNAAPAMQQHGAQVLATGQALADAGYLPGLAEYLSNQQLAQQAGAALLAQGMLSSQLVKENPDSAKALIQDLGNLAQQGEMTVNNVQTELSRSGSVLSQDLNAQFEASSLPGSSLAQEMARLVRPQTVNGLHDPFNLQQAALASGSFNRQLASSVGKELETFLQTGAENGVPGMHDEMSKQKAAFAKQLNAQVQSFSQPASALAKDVTDLAQQGWRSVNTIQDGILKQKSVLANDVHTQLSALSAPASTVAQDVTSLIRQGSQSSSNLQKGISHYATTLPSQLTVPITKDVVRNVGVELQQGINQATSQGLQQAHQIWRQQSAFAQYQPASSISIDVASLLQQGNEALSVVHGNLVRQQSALAQGLQNIQGQELHHALDVSSLLQAQPLPTAMQLQSQASLVKAQRPFSQVSQSAMQYQQQLHNMQEVVNHHLGQLGFVASATREEAAENANLIIEDVTSMEEKSKESVKQDSEGIDDAVVYTPQLTQLQRESSQLGKEVGSKDCGSSSQSEIMEVANSVIGEISSGVEAGVWGEANTGAVKLQFTVKKK